MTRENEELFILKTITVNFRGAGEGMIVVTFLDICGSDRRCFHVTVSNKDVELAESVHFARLLNRLLALRETIYK